MLNVLIVWIQIVKNHIRIARVTCSEHNNFKVLAQIFQDFLSVRPYVDTCFDDLASGESDR